MDLEDVEYQLSKAKLLGSKGTTGTQASFLELFDGDQETIDKIDPMIAKKMGFEKCYPVSGQTYSRKVDTRVLNILAGIRLDYKGEITYFGQYSDKQKENSGDIKNRIGYTGPGQVLSATVDS